MNKELFLTIVFKFADFQKLFLEKLDQVEQFQIFTIQNIMTRIGKSTFLANHQKAHLLLLRWEHWGIKNPLKKGLWWSSLAKIINAIYPLVILPKKLYRRYLTVLLIRHRLMSQVSQSLRFRRLFRIFAYSE